ncbi:MAG: hypothetical protein IPQ05_01440 [Leptospiraceae bacterium]|nr:hypothetical protein [Leptospiraceae bacterium]MBK7053999.1 hypothetical protein [Leptospiraceae bacterium]MBL0262544.1 hypothetical protein [Leptospiraceae bacterium]
MPWERGILKLNQIAQLSVTTSNKALLIVNTIQEKADEIERIGRTIKEKTE